jgi:PAS domain S-box-containing protein
MTNHEHVNSPEGENRIQAELVSQIYRQMPAGLVATGVNTLILAFILRGVVSHAILLTWVGVTLFLASCRYVLLVRYRRSKPKPDEACRWGKWSILGLGSSGVVWGATGIFLFPVDSLPHQVFIVFVLAGMVAGSVGTFSALKHAVYAFGIPALTPFTIRCLLLGDDMHLAMSAMITLFALLMFVTARNIGGKNREWAQIREYLAELVYERTAELADANEQLQLEVDERKQTGQALERSKKEWEATFDAISNWVSLIDPQGVILKTNLAGERFVGVPPAEMIGRKCFNLLHGSDKPTAECPLPVTLRTGQKAIAEIRMPGETWLRVTVDPVRDDRGEIIAAVHIVSDITERKQMEEALRRFKHIVATSSDLMSLVDRNFIYLAANDAYLKAYDKTRDEIVGHGVSEFLGEKAFQDKIKPCFERCLSGEKIVYDSWFDLPGPGRRYMQTHYYPYYGEGAVASGIVVTSRDITETKKLENQLRQTHKMEAIGTLAGGIAHEFNNMLAIILGNTEIVIDDTPEWHSSRSSLEEIRNAALRAKEVVRQLLDFSHATEHKRKPVKVGAVIQASMKIIHSSMPSTVEIRQDIDQEAGIVEADPSQINQVFINLCTNAADAMAEKGGVLEVTVKRKTFHADQAASLGLLEPGDYMSLMVKDTGCGMDVETVSRIFDPYFTTKEFGKGTGMGLSMAHGIVRNYGGTITVASVPGKGSTFEVLLPLSEAEILPEPEQETIPGGNERILFIDDEPALGKMAEQMLERLGYEVVTRTSSEEALELFKQEPDRFDLIITDMTMPGMTGDRLAGAVNAIRADIPVILCTGYSERISEEKAGALGIRAFVMKPLMKKDLAVTVRKALD